MSSNFSLRAIMSNKWHNSTTHNGGDNTTTTINPTIEPRLYLDHHDDTSNLAVATVVTEAEEEQNSYMPTAVEFDPDAKPAKTKKKILDLSSTTVRTVMALIVACLVATVLILAFTVLRSHVNRENLGLEEALEEFLGRSSDEWTPPYRQALTWIENGDPTKPLPGDDNLYQRFIVASLYYTTTQGGDWGYCYPSRNNNKNDDICVFPERLPNGKTHTRRGMRWLSGYHECEWVGVYCDDALQGQVQGLSLNGIGMTGPFPEVIEYLPYLEDLRLGDGRLEGPLPSTLPPQLQRLELQINQFTGTIPETWFALSSNLSLRDLDLSRNELTGTLSTSIFNLPQLHLLYLHQNMLAGTVPKEIGNATAVADLYLQHNAFHGTLPTTLGTMRAARDIRFAHNRLTGTIPTEVGKLQFLIDLALADNVLSGTLPTELSQLPRLSMIDVSNCRKLSGTLPPKMSPTLADLLLSHNEFSGTVPTSIAELRLLRELSLAGNNLTGSMPPSVCEQDLHRLTADCRAGAGGNDAEISCTCCTLCCDSNGEECEQQFT